MKKLFEKFTGKLFFIVTLCVVGYFCFLLLNYYVLKLEFFLISFFHEIFGIQLLFFQVLLLALSIVHCIKDKFRIKKYSFWSFLILLTSNSFFLGSIILHRIN